MSDETQPQERTQEPGTSTTLPVVPKVSPASETPISAPKFDEEALVEKVAARLEGLIEKKFQSTKDKRFADVERITNYLKANNNDVAKAMREMQIDDLLTGRESTPSRSVPGRDDDGEQQAALIAQTTDILNEAGIPFDDPAVKAWAGGSYPSEGAAVVALSKLVTKRLKQGAASTGRPTFDGSTTPPPDAGDKQKQIDAIDAEMPALYRDYSQNREKIAELKKKRGELMK